MRIRQVGDPILREVSLPVRTDAIMSQEIATLVAKMKDILNGIKSISDENGNALSAPQVGRLLRLIVLRLQGEFRVMINPEFKALSSQTFEFDEECFSLYDQRARLERFSQIEVSYLDEAAVAHAITLTGESAGLVQHEIDHLDGVLFTDRLEQAGRQAQSIDEQLSSQPERLAQVKAMIDYMIGD